MATDQGLMNHEEAARKLGCTPRMVRKLIETRAIDVVRVGALVRISDAAIADYIDRHTRPAVSR